MAIKEESTGQRVQCDGCGRLDAGPGTPLDIQSYAVLDPNVGGTVTHHYCTGCAANRGSDAREILNFGWTAVTPGLGPNETEEERQAAMQGEGGEASNQPRRGTRDTQAKAPRGAEQDRYN